MGLVLIYYFPYIPFLQDDARIGAEAQITVAIPGEGLKHFPVVWCVLGLYSIWSYGKVEETD